MKRRTKWLIVGSIVLVVGPVVFLQSLVDERAAALLRTKSRDVEVGWGRLRSLETRVASEGSARIVVEEVIVATGLLRKACDDSLRGGLGARIRLRGLDAKMAISPQQTVEWRADDVCIDVEVSPPWSALNLRAALNEPVRLAGPCAPSIERLSFSFSAPSAVHAGATIGDHTACVKALSFLAPTYPDHLLPSRLHLTLDSKDIDWAKGALSGSSSVTLLAELSRRLRKSEITWTASFDTISGQRVGACFRKEAEGHGYEYELALGISKEALDALTAPFVSDDSRSVLFDLRSEKAACDGGSHGLRVMSDLSEVTLGGKRLEPLAESHHGAPGLRTSSCAKSNDDAPCSYEFGIIQFDAQGKMPNPSQLEAVTRVATTGKRAWRDRRARNEPPLVVAFLHGWRHSAAPGDQNLKQFEDFVARLARETQAAHPDRPRRVVGVYLAWPGSVYDSFSANKLATFWNRLEVAQALGSPGSDLEGALRQLADLSHQERSDLPRGHLVTLAHSMGADPLLQVLARSPEPGAASDLAFVVAPAISIERYRSILESRAPSMPPFVAYGSTDDQVNQQLFPLGKALSFEGQSRQELYFHTTTVTSDASLITHRLRQSGSEVVLCAHEGSDLRARCAPEDAIDIAQALGASGIGRHDPIVAVDEAVIPGHAEFFTRSLVEHLVSSIVHMTRLPNQSSP